MKFSRMLCVVALIGFCALGARADATGAVLPDPTYTAHVNLDVASCSALDVTYCVVVDLTATFPCTDLGFLDPAPGDTCFNAGFTVPTPEPAEVAPTPTYNCVGTAPAGSSIFGFVDYAFPPGFSPGPNPTPPPPDAIFGLFTGCSYFGFYPPGGDTTPTITLGSNTPGPITLVGGTCDPTLSGEAGGVACGPDGTVDLAPEPSTGVLFMSGLLLLSLAGFARKRFGVGSVT